MLSFILPFPFSLSLSFCYTFSAVCFIGFGLLTINQHTSCLFLMINHHLVAHCSIITTLVVRIMICLCLFQNQLVNYFIQSISLNLMFHHCFYFNFGAAVSNTNSAVSSDLYYLMFSGFNHESIESS